MKKNLLPSIRMEAKPAGLTFQLPKSALAHWDRTLLAAKPKDKDIVPIDILGSVGNSGWDDNYVDAVGVKAQLKAAGKAPLLVTINSPGGDAFEGIAIYNLLREYAGDVTVNVIGIAASAASVIAMAGDRLHMGDGAFLMIHSAWGLVMGNRDDMMEFAAMLDKIDRAVAELYSKRSGLPVDEVLALMAAETYMTGAEAVEKGFADSLDDEPAKKKSARALAAPHAQQLAAVASLGASARARGYSVSLGATKLPGATGNQIKDDTAMKTTAEIIAAFEAKRAAHAARMEAIMTASAEAGETLDEATTEEYDGLVAEVETIDKHLARLKAHEVMMVKKATPVLPAAGASPDAASANRAANSGIISVKSNLEKGIGFTRYVKALAMAHGSPVGALAIVRANQRWMDETPGLEKVLMTAVAGGDTTTAGWASELVYNENLVNEFIELLYPQTILGKMTGVTRVPFNVRMGSQTSGSSANWIGQGVAIPVSKLGTSEVTLGIAKAAGLVVITQELMRSSSPSAELLVRNDLIKTIAKFLDIRFIDPNYAGVANVNPASITYAVGANAPTGTNYAALSTDVQTLFNTFITANLDPSQCVWIMPPTRALAISMMVNALSQPYFPGLSMFGGTFFGLPVITSMSANVTASPDAGNLMVLVKQDDILLADDGGITIDASREATIEQASDPTGDAAAGTAQSVNMVSMFQSDSVAIRAIRFINWAKRRSTAAAYIANALYA